MESLEGRLEPRHGAGVLAGGGRRWNSRPPLGRGSAVVEGRSGGIGQIGGAMGESWSRCVVGGRDGAGGGGARMRELEVAGVDALGRRNDGGHGEL